MTRTFLFRFCPHYFVHIPSCMHIRSVTGPARTQNLEWRSFNGLLLLLQRNGLGSGSSMNISFLFHFVVHGSLCFPSSLFVSVLGRSLFRLYQICIITLVMFASKLKIIVPIVFASIFTFFFVCRGTNFEVIYFVKTRKNCQK